MASLDDDNDIDLERDQPDFVLNTVSIPYAIWQRMQLLRDTYDMSHELLLSGYRDTTILSPDILRKIVQMHDICQKDGYRVLLRPLRDANLKNLLPCRLVDCMTQLFEQEKPRFWQVYAAVHLLHDHNLFEYMSAFVAHLCRTTEPYSADAIVERLAV